MLLGVNKGFKYKGFSDGKYVKLHPKFNGNQSGYDISE